MTKKRKLTLGPGDLKGLLIQHLEKLVFGLVLVLVLVFVFLGYRLQSGLVGKTPDKLDQLAARAVANIERPSMDELRKERIPRGGEGGQYAARVGQDAPPNPEMFTIKPWDQPLGNAGSKREDPTIFAPIKLETSALVGALCVRAEEGDVSPLAGLENAPAVEKKEKPAKRTRRGSGGYPGMAMPDSSPFDRAGGAAARRGLDEVSPRALAQGLDKDKKKKKDDAAPRRAERTYPESKVCGYRPLGGVDLSGRGMGMAETRPGGMMSDMPAHLSVGTPGGMLPDRSGATGGETTIPGQPIARSAHVVIVKALVPFRKQVDEYKRVLGEAIGYDPMRDQPRIIFFQAQRVDVTDHPDQEVQESDWRLVMTPKTAQAKAIEQRWYGVMPEVADPAYVDGYATLPCPPMMLRCMDDAMLHSDVPRGRGYAPWEVAAGAEGKPDEKARPEPTAASELPGGLPMVGGQPGMPGYGGEGRGMAGAGYPGMMEAPPRAGVGAPGMSAPSRAALEEMPMGGRGALLEMAGMRGMRPGSYPDSYRALTEAVQYKLIRFADLDVQPGHVYRYRVRVFLEDPNNPNTDPANGYVSLPPPRRSLTVRVIERLNKLQADDSSKGVYYVMSEWSEPTGLVTLPSSARLFAGSVEPARMAAGAEGTQVQQSEPYANVVPVAWQETRAVDVATETRVFRGSIANYNKRTFDVLDPVTLVIKVLRNVDLKTDHLIVDLRGGEDLPGDRKSPLTSAGEVALIDDRGNFVVRNELDDYLDYARFSLADEVSTTSSASGYPGRPSGPGEAGGSPAMMDREMPMGMGPTPGAGGKRGGRGAGAAAPGMGPPGGRRGR